MSTDEPNTCRTCGDPIYLENVRDHVGRATSEYRWQHWGPHDHDPVPRWVPDEKWTK